MEVNRNIPKPPSTKNEFIVLLKLILFFLLKSILWGLLLVASFSVVIYYLKLILLEGLLNKETIQFSIYLVIGITIILIIEKDKFNLLLGIKKEGEFINYKN